jgi:hypothetical protein
MGKTNVTLLFITFYFSSKGCLFTVSAKCKKIYDTACKIQKIRENGSTV